MEKPKKFSIDRAKFLTVFHACRTQWKIAKNKTPLSFFSLLAWKIKSDHSPKSTCMNVWAFMILTVTKGRLVRKRRGHRRIQLSWISFWQNSRVVSKSRVWASSSNNRLFVKTKMHAKQNNEFVLRQRPIVWWYGIMKF